MSWNIDPTAFIDKVEMDFTKLNKAVAITVLNECIKLSPVDTGRYRNSHIVSIDVPDHNVRDAGNIALSVGVSTVNNIKAGEYKRIYIQTNLPYSEALENGHSQQAPLGIYQLAYEHAVAVYS